MKKLLLLLVFSSSLSALKAQYIDLIDFTGTSGSYIGEYPGGSLTLSGDTLYGMTSGLTGEGVINEPGNIFSVQTDGTNYKDLVDFTGTAGSYNGETPFGSLTLSGNTLYGMTEAGGIYGYGNIFSVQTNGMNYRDLVDFTGTNGSYIGKNPYGSLTLSGDTLYGMTCTGGINGYGNIFSVQTNGTNFIDLVNFTGTIGSYSGYHPFGSLTLSSDTLYGMTQGGGHNNGNIFSVQTNGTNFKDLIDFTGTSGSYIGKYPTYGSLILLGDTLYGITSWGGMNQIGNIFSVQTNGTNYKDLIEFTGISGSFIGEDPLGSLTLSGNTLYGMTSEYWLDRFYGSGNIFSVQTNGTNYKDLIDFTDTSGSYIGFEPTSSLTLSGNILYGMTYLGGVSGLGNIFSFNYKTASVNSLSAGNGQLKVYPNPNNGIFTIALSHAVPITIGIVLASQTLEVYNVLGEKVMTETLRSAQGDNTIDLNGKPNGIYLYRIINENGELIGEGKFIIE